MATNYILQVPDPCKQDWHTMQAGQGERFCTHCSKSVIDFSKLNDEQIIALLENKKGSVCGRLNNTQLNRMLSTQAPLQPQSRLSKIFAAMLLLLTARETYAYNRPSKPATFIQAPVEEKVTERYPDNADTSHASELSGRVLDSISRTPVDFATVENISTKKTYLTDSSGAFKIAASMGDTIKIALMGYSTQQFVVKSFASKDYLLSENYRYMTMGLMVRYKPTVKDKVKHFFKTGKVSTY